MFLILKAEDIHPKVRIANHHPVPQNMIWERSIPDPQIVCIIDGDFQYEETGHPSLRLAPGDFLFIEPNIWHRLLLDPTLPSGEIAGLHFEFTSDGAWAAGDYRLGMKTRRVTHISESAYLQERFCRLAAIYESYQPYRSELVSAIAAEIILTLAAYWEDEIERAVHPSERMKTILNYIRANLVTPLSRQSLAETFNLSAGYINYLFKIELGMTPSAVINRERVARAYHLIDREGVSVTEAALAVGFQDPFYFSRVFKQIYLIPPSQVGSNRRVQPASPPNNRKTGELETPYSTLDASPEFEEYYPNAW